MDDDLAEAIQEQVVAGSLTENPGASQAEIDEEQSLFGDV